MPNKVIIFPVEKKTQADAYKAACDAHFATTFQAGGVFAYVATDAYGQWVVPYYGAPWEFITGQPFTPPPEIEALRADGVLHDTAVWPEEPIE